MILVTRQGRCMCLAPTVVEVRGGDAAIYWRDKLRRRGGNFAADAAVREAKALAERRAFAVHQGARVRVSRGGPLEANPAGSTRARWAIIHAGRARRVASFFRRLSPIGPRERNDRDGFTVRYPDGCSRKTGDVCGQITHRNALCRKLTLYFVSRMLIRFIIKGISVRCIALHIQRGPVRGATVHFDSWGPHGLDATGR